MSKNKAAKIVNTKKKSLDDYLMFLRYGITMNFDFKNNLNNSFG